MGAAPHPRPWKIARCWTWVAAPAGMSMRFPPWWAERASVGVDMTEQILLAKHLEFQTHSLASPVPT
jgi:hypothetical protein